MTEREALETPPAVVPLLSCGQWLGADARLVSEILGAKGARPLAGSHEAVLGVIPWRGRAVSLVDTGRLLALRPTPEFPAITERSAENGSGPRRIVIVHSGPSLFALTADAVREVQTLDGAALSLPDKAADPLAPRRALLWDDRRDRERWRRRPPHSRSPLVLSPAPRSERAGHLSIDPGSPPSEPSSRVRIPVLLLDIAAIARALADGAQPIDALPRDGDAPSSRNGPLGWPS